MSADLEPLVDAIDRARDRVAYTELYRQTVAEGGNVTLLKLADASRFRARCALDDALRAYNERNRATLAASEAPRLPRSVGGNW